ncbi:MAG TPA: hypothetical protein VMZ53_26495, partial [Kofleriaceae bacterium]|nr:hypothetical protein [Kofleriaceae bacterium]
PRASTPPPVGGFTSGLSAAFSGEQPAASLGALEGGDIPLSLSSVDGTDRSGPVAAAVFEPPSSGESLPASIGPAPEKPKAPEKKAKPKDEPLDLFAPPESQGEQFKVQLEGETERPAAQPVERKSKPSLQVPNMMGGTAVEGGVSAPSTSKLGPLGNERVRYIVGVVLAILIGFLPAHFVASSMEQGAYDELDQKVIRAQQQADTPELYAALDKTRADFLDRKEAERRNAAIIALVIWGIVGGGIAFAWFKKIPWDSFE